MSILEPAPRRIHTRMAGFIIMAVLVLLVGAGCADNQGSFKRDAQVTQAFQTGQSDTGYNYFFSGRDTMPYAIVGIESSYSIQSPYWLSVDPGSEQFRRMSGNIYGKHKYYPIGSHIIDPEGTIIGVWYSTIDFRSVRVDPQTRTVEVLFVNPESRRQY